ncbi:hypothetical protein LMIY3S_01397 [Labrys miyagiensis]
MAVSNIRHRVGRARRGLVPAAALAGLFLAAPAHAATATPAGAKAITDGFARYFGRKLVDRGVITVTPKGDHYDLTYALDGAKLGLPADGPQFQFGPVTVQLTQKDDGSYAFTASHPSIDVTFKSPKGAEPLEFAEHLKNCSGNGVFDFKSMPFGNQAMACESVTVAMRSSVEDVDASMGKLTYVSNAKPGDDGVVDVAMTWEAVDLVETVTVKDPRNPMPPIAIRSDRIHQEATIAGFHNTRLLDVLAFFAEHDFAVGSAYRTEAQVKLKAALPIWQGLKGDITYSNLSVGTPKGIVKVASVDSQTVSTGAVKNAEVGMNTSFSGLELPDGMVPDWAAPLVPKSGVVNLKLTGADFDTMANQLIETFVVPKGEVKPDALKSAFLASFLGGSPHLAFEQSVTAPAFDLKGQGETSLMPSQQGKASVSASSLDGVMTAFTNAASTMPNAQQGVMGIAFLKGLAKTGPDGRLTWDIGFDSASKTVTVNGQSFGPGAKKP